jgi:membrane protease subunit HflC
MSKAFSGVLAVLAAIVMIVVYSSLFTVNQNQQAIVLRFGEPIRIITDPGLQYKIPVMDSVVYIDKRILYLDNPAQ